MPLGNFQNVCALPDEVAYEPDKTNNYELGVKSQWLDKRLTLNGSVYYIEWKKPQLPSSTVNGSGTIIRNGEGAASKGFEGSFNYNITENLSIRGSYAYTHAELTAVARDLISTIPDPSLPLPPRGSPFGTIRVDGEDGDRLPGSPKHQGSLVVDYQRELTNGMNFGMTYGVRAVSDIYSRVGNRGGGVMLDGYAMHNLSASISQPDNWSITLYADNLFDKYAESGVSGNPRYNQNVTNDAGGIVYLRSYYTNPLPPRRIGVRLTKKFGG